MKPETEAALARLERDLPLDGLAPMRWLDNHRLDVSSLLTTEPIHVLTDATGLNSATILRWRTERQKAPADLKPGPDYADLAYWRGRAEAYREALEMLALRR